jgi:hypothetical protein
MKTAGERGFCFLYLTIVSRSGNSEWQEGANKSLETRMMQRNFQNSITLLLLRQTSKRFVLTNTFMFQLSADIALTYFLLVTGSIRLSFTEFMRDLNPALLLHYCIRLTL